MEEDTTLFRDKSRYFMGRAKIRLSALRFQRTMHINETNDVYKLVKVFQGEGCHRVDPWNHVPVIISRDEVSRQLQASGHDRNDLMDEMKPPLLEFPDNSVTLLHGRRRLLAAEKCTGVFDKWWTAELYSEDLPRELKTSLCEQYSHCRPFCDGEIYRRILKYQRASDIDEMEKWELRLSNSKYSNLKQLRNKYRRLAKGFDLLDPFTGIWYQLHLGCLSRLLPYRIPEELLCYLERMHRQLSSIMSTENPALLCPTTIHEIETLVPKYSKSDAAKIKDLMDKNKIFPAIESAERRKKLLNNILGIDGRILSFYTFLQDTIYFGACSKILRGLLPSKFSGSIREAFLCSYVNGRNTGRIRLQLMGDRILDRSGDEKTHIRQAYRQLFLAAMRDFPIMCSLEPLRDNKKKKPLMQGSSMERWHNFASLAHVLGFKTDQITALIKEGNSNEIMAREFLTRIRPQELYNVDEYRKARLVRYIAEHIDDMATERRIVEVAEFTTDLEGLAKSQRCNRPSDAAYNRDRSFLYLDRMLDASISPRAHVTSLAIQRDIFLCFLGLDVQPQSTAAEEDQQNDDLMGRGREPENGRILDDTAPADELVPSTTEDDFRTARTSLESGLSLGRRRNSFHTLESNSSLSQVIQQFKSIENMVVLYIWDKRQYVNFESNAQHKGIFEEITRELADEGRRFIFLTEDNQILTQTLDGLWENVLRRKVVLAGPKVDPSFPVESDVNMQSATEFLSFLDKQYR